MLTKTNMKKLIVVTVVLAFVVLSAWAAFCPYCGQELGGDFKFCPGCGKSLKGVPGLTNGVRDNGRDDAKRNGEAEEDEKGKNWYTRHELPTRQEIEDFLAEPNSLLVDVENFELISSGSSYNLYQLDAIEDMYGREVSRKMDHLSANGKKYWIYKVANITVEKYEKRQVGKWEIRAAEQDDDFRVLTREGISLGMDLSEARDRMRECSYKFHKEKSKNKQRVLYYKKSRRFNTDYFVELWFSPGENRLIKLRYGTLTRR